MSNKTQLQTNNTRLTSLITELQGKAAGGGSGGSVETCTVELEIAGYWHNYSFTTYENDAFNVNSYFGSSNEATTIIIENVVCGSFFSIYPSFGAPQAIITGGAELLNTLYGMHFQATSIANETTHIRIYSNL